MAKTLKNKLNISMLDRLRTRVFQFSLQRWVIFATVFAISFLLLWNFDFFDGSLISKIKNEWTSLAWRFALIFILYSVARPIAKFIAESFNRNIYAWLATLLFVAYAVCLYIFTKDERPTGLSSIKLTYFAWVLPGVVLPIVYRLIGTLITAKVSPLQSKKNLFNFLTLVSFAPISISGTLFLYLDFVEGIPFSFDNWKYQVIISTIVIGLFFGLLFGIYGWWKFRKIKFNNQNISIPLVVILPIFITILIWMFRGTFEIDLNMTPEMWFLVAVGILVLLLVVFTFFFAKEVKFAKIMNSLFSTSLILIWIGVFAYVNYFGLVNDSYVVVDMAAAASVIIFILMAIFDKSTKAGAVQESLFTLMIVIMMLLILLFTIVGKARLFDALMQFAPVDLKALLPVLLIAMPGAYFIISITKIMWAQSRITHGIRIEKAIKKRKALELALAEGEKHE